MAQAEQVGLLAASGYKFSKNNAVLNALAFYEWVIACDKYSKVVMLPTRPVDVTEVTVTLMTIDAQLVH